MFNFATFGSMWAVTLNIEDQMVLFMFFEVALGNCIIGAESDITAVEIIIVYQLIDAMLEF